MATWRAKCWLGSESGYQELEVQSNTFNGADKRLREIYGAEQVINLRKVNGGSSSSDTSDLGSLIALAGIFFGIWLLYNYWWIVVPVSGIIFWIKMAMRNG
jgi:hypothetical protein